MCRNGLSLLKFSYALWQKISIYPRFAVYLCQDSYLNVHWNKKCSVFHIHLFSERYDFRDFDIGCSSVPNIHVLTRGLNQGVGHAISNLALGMGQSFLCRREGVGYVFFINYISKCSGPPPPPPLYFLTSPLTFKNYPEMVDRWLENL